MQMQCTRLPGFPVQGTSYTKNANRAGCAYLESLERAREDAAKRVGSWAGDQEAQGNKQDRQGVFEAAFADVETMGKVNQVNSTDHDDDHADGSNTLQGAEEDREAATELGQAHQVAGGHRKVQESREALRSRAAKGSKQDDAAVIEDGERARYAKDQKSEIRCGGAFGGLHGSVAHGDLDRK